MPYGVERSTQRINLFDHRRDGDFFLRERVECRRKDAAAGADDGDLVDDKRRERRIL